MIGGRILAATLAIGALGATSCVGAHKHRAAHGALSGAYAYGGGDAPKGGVPSGPGASPYFVIQQNAIHECVPNAQVTQSVYTDPQFAPHGERALHVRMENDLLFYFDSDKLLPESLFTLARLTSVLIDPRYPTPRCVIIAVHSDGSGDPEDNRELSRRRADEIADYMVYRGLERSLAAPVGVGPDEPAADNSTEYGRAVNRRVEVHILPGDSLTGPGGA